MTEHDSSPSGPGSEPEETSKSGSTRQQQFLSVVSKDEARRRFLSVLSLKSPGVETIEASMSLGRVLAEDVASSIDVTAFDRSNVDGFAVQATSTWGATEDEPAELAINPESISPGVVPGISVMPGTATPIATGGMIPRGADAVVMIEDTDPAAGVASHNDGTTTDDAKVLVKRTLAPGQMITFAGTDVASGDQVLHKGMVITPRELGVIAALGLTRIAVMKRPTVGILSTGDEIVAPGEHLPVGSVYDSNAAILSASVTELGCQPVLLGIVPDDPERMAAAITRGLELDALVLSGGTSKGAGDLSYRIINEVTAPGIITHGVALKPGKPVCLASHHGKPVVILPGFPTSAIFTFTEFVAPVLRRLAGQPASTRKRIDATVPSRVNSQRGRTEYVLANLVKRPDGLTAFPLGKGSGSVTTFSHADGFFTIDEQHEYLDAGTSVEVELLSDQLQLADLVTIGSHCIGLDIILQTVREAGWTTKSLTVGSKGGLQALRRGECHIAGIHLLDPETDEYNTPFLPESAVLIGGYRRRQGIVFRKDDNRFAGMTQASEVIERLETPGLRMVNRNMGSGTRVLIDQLLNQHSSRSKKPDGFAVQPSSHNAVVAAIEQSRADWGVAIESVSRQRGLGFVPLRDELYEFVTMPEVIGTEAVDAFRNALSDQEVITALRSTGFELFTRSSQKSD